MKFKKIRVLDDLTSRIQNPLDYVALLGVLLLIITIVRVVFMDMDPYGHVLYRASSAVFELWSLYRVFGLFEQSR
jgi:hypothetical protein